MLSKSVHGVPLVPEVAVCERRKFHQIKVKSKVYIEYVEIV